MSSFPSPSGDHSLRYAGEFIHTNGLPKEAVIEWLEGAGGYCDCEAINNAEEQREDAVPGYRDLAPRDGVRGWFLHNTRRRLRRHASR